MSKRKATSNSSSSSKAQKRDFAKEIEDAATREEAEELYLKYTHYAALAKERVDAFKEVEQEEALSYEGNNGIKCDFCDNTWKPNDSEHSFHCDNVGALSYGQSGPMCGKNFCAECKPASCSECNNEGEQVCQDCTGTCYTCSKPLCTYCKNTCEGNYCPEDDMTHCDNCMVDHGHCRMCKGCIEQEFG